MEASENQNVTKAAESDLTRDNHQEMAARVGMRFPRLYTVREVAAYLRLSKAQVYAMIQKRELPIIRVSERRIVVSESDLVAWIQKRMAFEPSQLVFMLDRI